MNLIPLVIVALLLSACAGAGNYTQNMGSWQGKKVTTLVQTWGQPTYQIPGSSGNTLYIYQKRTAAYPQPVAPPVATVVSGKRVAIVPVSPDAWRRGGQGLQAYCITTFEVNKSNVIVSASSRGNGCVLLTPRGPK